MKEINLRKARAGVVAAIAMLPGLGLPSAVPAAQWELQPFLDLGAVYDDNIQLTNGPHDSTSGYFAAARLEAKRTTETSKVNANGALVHTAYRQAAVPDKTEGGVTLNAETQTSERGKLGLDGEIRHDALFETATIPRGTGNVRDTDVGLSTNTQVRRDYRTLQPSWNWLLTELSAVRLAVRLTDANFSNEAGTGLVDYKEDLLSATYSRQLNPKDDVSVTTNVVRYRPATGGNDADTRQLLAGVGRLFSETVRGSIAAGASRTKLGSPTGEDTASGLVTTASLRQTSELETLEGVISRDITPSGAGQALRTDQIRLYWSRRVSAQTEFVFETQLFRNRVLEGSNPAIDRRYVELVPQLRWQWLENLYVVGSFRYRQQKFDALPGSAESNTVFLGISYRL
jgi:hypothetical protein